LSTATEHGANPSASQHAREGSALGDGHAMATLGTSVREALHWALEYADRIDPLRE
jgi:hypothetical protein